MKIQKSVMVSAIDKVKGVIPKKASVAALEGALVKDGYLIATNTEMAVQVKLWPAGANDRYVIPAKALDMIRKMPDGDVDIKMDGKDVVSISCGAARNRAATVEPDAFTFDAIKETGEKFVTVDGAVLLGNLKRVGFAASPSAAQMKMRGIYFEGEGDHFNLVALDGHRVAVTEVPATGADGISFIVPKTSTDRLASLINTSGEEVKISLDEYSAIFEGEEWAASARLIDGDYFDYKKMMAMKGDHVIELPKKELVAALGRATMVASGAVPIIIEASGGYVTISVNAPTGDYREELALDIPAGQDIRIGFDSKLLLESISNFNGDTIILTYNNANSPVYITERYLEKMSPYTVLVLPVKIH